MVSSVAGGADPGRGSERFSERLFCREPAANQRFRIRVLRDVACRPSVKTGANVPSYSGGFAALLVDSYWVFEGCGLGAIVSSVAGGVDPGRGAERFSERFFGTNQ